LRRSTLTGDRGENVLVAAVTHLVTLVETEDDGTDTRQMHVSARHEAVLADGRHVLLLDDRGWSGGLMVSFAPGESATPPPAADAPDIWTAMSVEQIERTARGVVGPDEPFGGESREEAEAGHWAYLAGILREQGVIVDPAELGRLPHEVVLGQRLRALVDRDR
jgi:hypothetical protein